ncbi:MAG: 3'(2'),5'-bisphosphate nucleotidase CysQ [Actinomycetota bacterium]|nr:3'(2'),5'-bisphosphate nucleotidase CysQ [Actinomycetota bacterium]
MRAVSEGRDDDHAVAVRVAEAAGQVLVELRTREDLHGRALRDEGDRRAHETIVALLARTRPDDAVLSEEARDDPVRLRRRRVWIVDPLDGTREYGERDRSDWAVHVALVVDGTPVAGAVALPALGLTLTTGEPPGLSPRSDGPPRMVVSRTRPPAVTEPVRVALGAELVAMGSAGAKAMAVVRGHADVYAHAGGQYEWDSAAPVAVAAAAGLHVSRLDGSPLRYNNADVWLPDLLICRPELAAAVVAAAAT